MFSRPRGKEAITLKEIWLELYKKVYTAWQKNQTEIYLKEILTEMVACATDREKLTKPNATDLLVTRLRTLPFSKIAKESGISSQITKLITDELKSNALNFQKLTLEDLSKEMAAIISSESSENEQSSTPTTIVEARPNEIRSSNLNAYLTSTNLATTIKNCDISTIQSLLHEINDYVLSYSPSEDLKLIIYACWKKLITELGERRVGEMIRLLQSAKYDEAKEIIDSYIKYYKSQSLVSEELKEFYTLMMGKMAYYINFVGDIEAKVKTFETIITLCNDHEIKLDGITLTNYIIQYHSLLYSETLNNFFTETLFNQMYKLIITCDVLSIEEKHAHCIDAIKALFNYSKNISINGGDAAAYYETIIKMRKKALDLYKTQRHNGMYINEEKGESIALTLITYLVGYSRNCSVWGDCQHGCLLLEEARKIAIEFNYKNEIEDLDKLIEDTKNGKFLDEESGNDGDNEYCSDDGEEQEDKHENFRKNRKRTYLFNSSDDEQEKKAKLNEPTDSDDQNLNNSLLS